MDRTYTSAIGLIHEYIATLRRLWHVFASKNEANTVCIRLTDARNEEVLSSMPSA